MQTPKNTREMVGEDHVEKRAAEGRSNYVIRDVWAHNLDEEFARIGQTADDYPYVAVHSVFPGVVTRPVGNFKNSADYEYEAFKGNVNILKLIQLGLTFFDKGGNLPTDGTGKYILWQFNFCGFDLTTDVYAIDSIYPLKQSGIDFDKNNEMGIDLNNFGERVMSSGIVLTDEIRDEVTAPTIRWVTCNSGYDLGFLLKVLTGKSLPDSRKDFLKLASTYFPVVYDIRHLMKFCDLEMGKNDACHQAGMRSLLASCQFMKLKLKDEFFNGSLEQYAGVLYGLGEEED